MHPARPGLDVDVVDSSGMLMQDDLLWLREHIERASTRLGCCGVIVFKVVSDEEMAAAHSRHSSMEGTTDVLTFEWQPPQRRADPRELLLNIKRTNPPESPIHIVIDILACADEADRQAQPRGYHFRKELLLYAVHGILHGLGLDDQKEDQAREMHMIEDEVLTAIGVGAVFGSTWEDSG